MENIFKKDYKGNQFDENKENSRIFKKHKDGLNTSNISKDVGMNDIIDQIGNLMKKFANEVNVTKGNITQNEDDNKNNQYLSNEENQNKDYFNQKDDEYYLYQPQGEKYVNHLKGINTSQDESQDDLFYAKEMNLYNNLQKKLEKQREKKLIEEQQKNQVPWQISKNSRKIIGNKFKDEKPLYERSLELAEKKKRELENASRRVEIEKEKEMKKLKTKWNNEKKIKKEDFEEFIEKQKLWELNKQTKVTILREEYDEIEKKAIVDTMFKPDIGKKPIVIAKKINNDGKKVHERLYEYNEELRNKKANLEKKNKHNFIPIINKKLPKYLINKNKNRNEEMFFGENNHIDYSNYSNEIAFQEETNNDYANNLKNSSYVDNQNAYKLKENDTNTKRTIDRETLMINRKSSAPTERYNPNFNVPINSIQKNKLEKKDFDLNEKGLKSDFNNINAGNNLKVLIKDKQDDPKIEPKPKNYQEIVYRNLSNGKINKKLSDKFPLERFSVPINSIKINYPPMNTDEENAHVKEQSNKNIKRLNTMIPESKKKIDNISDLKTDFNRHSIIKHQSSNMPVQNKHEPYMEDFANLSGIIMMEDSVKQSNNNLALRKDSINKININKKRMSTSLIEENRSKNLIMNSLNKEEEIYFNDNGMKNNLINNMFANEKRVSLNQNEAFVLGNYKNALNLYDNVGNLRNKL